MSKQKSRNSNRNVDEATNAYLTSMREAASDEDWQGRSSDAEQREGHHRRRSRSLDA